ncbi:hypothetical protein TNCV_5135831 [Trichonephila clavipes]|nr:hypothetical protein TNCV_5135831 [Trichonephila clavipes]
MLNLTQVAKTTSKLAPTSQISTPDQCESFESLQIKRLSIPPHGSYLVESQHLKPQLNRNITQRVRGHVHSDTDGPETS